jgi:hypothetical protein
VEPRAPSVRQVPAAKTAIPALEAHRASPAKQGLLVRPVLRVSLVLPAPAAKLAHAALPESPANAAKEVPKGPPGPLARPATRARLVRLARAGKLARQVPVAKPVRRV